MADTVHVFVFRVVDFSFYLGIVSASVNMATRQLSCEECNVKFSGPLPYIDHIKSAKHLKKVAAVRQLQSVLDVVSTASEAKEAGDMPNVATVQKKDPLPFTCELCNVSMNSEAALIAHTKGKKHLKALKYQEDLLRLATEKESLESPAEQNSAKATSSTGTPPQKRTTEIADLSCEYCGIVLFKNFGYKLEHLESESHCKKKSQVIGQSIKGSISEEPSAKRVKVESPSSMEAVSGSGSAPDEAEGNETDGALSSDGLQPTVDEDESLDVGSILKDLN